MARVIVRAFVRANALSPVTEKQSVNTTESRFLLVLGFLPYGVQGRTETILFGGGGGGISNQFPNKSRFLPDHFTDKSRFFPT